MNLYTRIRRALDPEWAREQDALALYEAIENEAEEIYTAGGNLDRTLHIRMDLWKLLMSTVWVDTYEWRNNQYLVTAFARFPVTIDPAVSTWMLLEDK